MTHAAQDRAPHPHAHTEADDAGQAEILDLDAEALAGHLATITSWLPVTAAPRRIVDLGCGTGAGTLALLDRFPDAEVTAVDASAGHLDRLREKARTQGVDTRVRTVLADLDTDWPDLGSPDLVWASASLHHLADPDRGLRLLHDALTPGGLLAVLELADFPRFLPADAPEDAPGLEDRCHAARAHHHAAHLPHRGADWGPRLTAAGFTVEDTRTVDVRLDPAHSPAVGRYALASLQRLRSSAASTLSPDDLAALDRLLTPAGPHHLLLRPDLALRTHRTFWAARRA